MRLHTFFRIVSAFVVLSAWLIVAPQRTLGQASEPVPITTIVGDALLDGQGPRAGFFDPHGIDISPDGTFALVVDTNYHSVRRVDLATGEVTTPANTFRLFNPFGFPQGVAISPDGSFAIIGDSGFFRIQKLDLTTNITTVIAGSEEGSVDGVAAAAKFSFTREIDISPDGSFVLITDANNHTIRRLDLATLLVTTIAGSPDQIGSADGIAAAARFSDPQGMAISPDGAYALVADTNNHTIRRIDLDTNTVTTIAGTVGLSGVVNATGPAARFSNPVGIDISSDGAFAIIADRSGETLRRMNLNTLVVTTVAGVAGSPGFADGVGSTARFFSPRGVAIAPDNLSVLLVDGGNNALRRIDLSTSLVTTIAGEPGNSRYREATGSRARFHDPQDIVVGSGFALIADTGNHVIRHLELATGVTSVLAGASEEEGQTDGPGSQARFSYPFGIALSSDERFALVADHNNHRIRRIDLVSGTVSTVAGGASGSPPSEGSADGIGTAARFMRPEEVQISPDDSFALVADTGNRTIRRINLSTNEVTTIAGLAGGSGFVDGIGSAARFDAPVGIAINGSTAYIADRGNNRVRVLNLTTRAVTTLVSNGLSAPQDVALSADRRSLVLTNAGSVMRVQLSGGGLSLLAGQDGQVGFVDGVGDVVRFGELGGIAFEPQGTFALVIDRGMATVRLLGVLSVAPNRVRTLAGGGEPGAVDAEGRSARFRSPLSVAIHPDGRYALSADTDNHTIRKVDVLDGLVTTFAGTAGQPGTRDGVGTQARFNFPASIAISPDGAFALVGDDGNNTIRRINLNTAEVTTLAPLPTGGPGLDIRKVSIVGIAISRAPNQFALISDADNHVVLKLDLTTNQIQTFIGQSGSPGNIDGTGGAARLDEPGGVAINADSTRALVADTGNNAVRMVNLTTGQITTVDRSASVTAIAPAIRKVSIVGITWSHDEKTALVTDVGAHTLIGVDLANGDAQVLAGATGIAGNVDGVGYQARLNEPAAISMSADGRFALISDAGGHGIRQLDAVFPYRVMFPLLIRP